MPRTARWSVQGLVSWCPVVLQLGPARISVEPHPVGSHRTPSDRIPFWRRGGVGGWGGARWRLGRMPSGYPPPTAFAVEQGVWDHILKLLISIFSNRGGCPVRFSLPPGGILRVFWGGLALLVSTLKIGLYSEAPKSYFRRPKPSKNRPQDPPKPSPKKHLILQRPKSSKIPPLLYENLIFDIHWP